MTAIRDRDRDEEKAHRRKQSPFGPADAGKYRDRQWHGSEQDRRDEPAELLAERHITGPIATEDRGDAQCHGSDDCGGDQGIRRRCKTSRQPLDTERITGPPWLRGDRAGETAARSRSPPPSRRQPCRRAGSSGPTEADRSERPVPGRGRTSARPGPIASGPSSSTALENSPNGAWKTSSPPTAYPNVHSATVAPPASRTAATRPVPVRPARTNPTRT